MASHNLDHNIVASHNSSCWHSIVLAILIRPDVRYFLKLFIFVFFFVFVLVFTKFEPVVVFKLFKWPNFRSEARGLQTSFDCL